MKHSSHNSRPARPRVALREWLVALSGGLTLAFSAWGLGGIPAWSLHVLLAGGITTLVLAFLPLPRKWQIPATPPASQGTGAGSGAQRTDENDRLRGFNTLRPLKQAELQPTHLSRRIAEETEPLNTGKAHKNSTASAAKRLLRWPFFYFSLAFLLYLLIGALNPAAQVVSDERGWWVEAIQPRFAIWLPTSVQSDYQPMNAWRVLAAFTAAFSLAWGLWAGLTRRAPVLLVLWCLLLSGAAMGLVGILQHLSEAKTVLWTFPSSNRNFWGSFFYRNQAAAYLNLVLILSAFLFFYHGVKTRERLGSGGPHFLCFLLFALTAASIGLALSRGGILFASVLSVVFATLLLIFLLQGLLHINSFWLALIPIVLLAVGSFISIRYIDIDAIETRFGDIGETLESADQDFRVIGSKATWDMAQGRLTLGWGAGSFRYIFPMYQRNYPELMYRRFDQRKQLWVGRRMFRYAHNDILQFTAEYGLVGAGLVFGAILMLLLQALYHSGSNVLAALILFVGVSQAFGHAFLDFIFNSPAYWMAFIGLIALSTRLLSLEAARSRTRRSV